MPETPIEITAFDQLPLSDAILRAVRDVGYETPSPIQARSIPHLLEGRDLLGLAQTGTGKTAAFALPALSRINASLNETQVLLLCPTRELAIQVAEACQSYARYIPNFHVRPSTAFRICVPAAWPAPWCSGCRWYPSGIIICAAAVSSWKTLNRT